MTTRYKHTQRAIVVFIALTISLVILAVITMSSPSSARLAIIMVLPIMVVTTLLFSSLTVVVTDTTLAWRFGIGFPRKSVPLSDIATVEPVRTRWWNGWGIHLTEDGWLYNVSGFDALRITLRSGKRFLLGTNDPAGLQAALRASMASTPQSTPDRPA